MANPLYLDQQGPSWYTVYRDGILLGEVAKRPVEVVPGMTSTERWRYRLPRGNWQGAYRLQRDAICEMLAKSRRG